MITRLLVVALALIVSSTGCVASRTVRLELGPSRGDVLGRITVEDARPPQDREFRSGDDEEGRCTRWYGDRFIEPSKTEYLRRLVAERVVPAGNLVLKIDRFDTVERCESARRQAKRSAMLGGGLLGAMVASALPSGSKRGDDDFEVRLEGTANGVPFRFSRTFDHSDLGGAAPSAPEYLARIEKIFAAFAEELKKGAGAATANAVTSAAGPAPLTPTLSPRLPPGGEGGVAAAASRSPSPPRAQLREGDRTASGSPSPPASRGERAGVRGEATPSPSATARLYQQQCDVGSAEACSTLGALYDAGREVPRDLPRAKALYRRGCDGGVPRACANLGAVIEGERKDYPAAAALYRRACDAGNATGCLNLGRLSVTGRGVEKDPAAGATLYQTACEGGQAKGCTLLARLYEAGTGVDRDAERAAALYDAACRRGDAAACDRAPAQAP